MKDKNHKRRTRSQIAKCQILNRCPNSPNKKKYRSYKCKDRFQCFAERFDITDVTLPPRWVCYAPNNKEGKQLVALLRKYVNKDLYFIKVRGRAKNRKQKGGCQSSQPLAQADAFAIYMYQTKLAQIIKANDPWGLTNKKGRSII